MYNMSEVILKFLIFSVILGCIGGCGENEIHMQSNGTTELRQLIATSRGANIVGEHIHQSTELTLATGESVREITYWKNRLVPQKITYDLAGQKTFPIGMLEREALRTIHGLGIDISPENLIKSKDFFTRPVDSLVMLKWHQIYEQIPVGGAALQVTFKRVSNKPEQWKIAKIINNTFQDIFASNHQSQKGNIDHILSFYDITDFTLGKTRQIIYPEGDFDGNYTFHRATQFQLHQQAGDEQLSITVIDDSDIVLEAISSRLHADDHDLHIEAYDRSYYYDDKKFFPIKDLANKSESISSGEEATITLKNQRAVVYENRSRQVEEITANVEQANDKLVFKTTDTDLPAINSFISVNRIAEEATQFITEAQLPELMEPVTVKFNLTDNRCNAFYDIRRNSLNFYKEGRGCGNTALVSEIIWHEWGHAIDNWAGGLGDRAFSEGIGDVVASYMSGSPNLGPGFQANKEQGVRQVNSGIKYPCRGCGVHKEGQIIASAFWSMREGFIKIYGRKLGGKKASELFYKHILITDRYTDSYEQILSLDGKNTTAGQSPHFCLINKAFASHNLAEDKGCKDKNVGFGQDIYLAIHREETANSVTVKASAKNSKKVGICLNDIETCFEKTAIAISFTAQTNSYGNQIFIADEALDIEKNKRVTIISYNEPDTPINMKEVIFEPRKPETQK